MQPALPAALAAAKVQWLPAEASARRYVRLLRPRGVDRPSAIAMLFAPDTDPGEVQRVERATALLARAGLPVPETYGSNPEQRWILQEDLGDLTLARARAQGLPVAWAYSQAVALLEPLSPLVLATSPRPPLDARRLRAELDHFAVQALGLTDGPGSGLAAEFDALVAAALSEGQVCCHRDYHGRNLLLQDDRVRVLDHQDAMSGPKAYDRVSLAYDPYVELTDAIRDRIAGEQTPGLAATAVQRLVKALGTFAEKGGPWLPSVAPAARQARRLLTRSGLSAPLLDLALATQLAKAPSAAGPTPPAARAQGAL